MLTKALLKLVVQYNWKTIRSLCCNGLPHHFQGSCLLISTSKAFCFWVSMGFTPVDLLGPQGKKAFLYIASRINFAICEVWNGRDTSYLGENTEKENRQDERKEGGREQLLVMLPSWIGVLSSQIRKALWHMRCWAIRNSPSKRLYLRHSLISKTVVLPLFVSLYFGHWIINWTIFFPLKGSSKTFLFPASSSFSQRKVSLQANFPPSCALFSMKWKNKKKFQLLPSLFYTCRRS